MATIELVGVSKIFERSGGRRVEAVKKLDLQICNREFVVLLGPSGCGKTTTLRLIAGLEEVTTGEIRIGGRVMNGTPAKDRDIAMVFQNYALYPHMTAYENMAFGLRLRGVNRSEIDRRVRDAAGILGITDILDRKPGTLSGGQCQRVAVGRAIVRQPKAFLFDEPLSNLDAKLRAQMRTELLKLHQRLQATMVYVTHDQVEAMTMGERIAVMHNGELQQYGTPIEIYRRPENVFVAGFIGTPGMNFLHGSLRCEGGRIYFQAADVDSFRISMSNFNGASRWMGRDLLLGMRAEDISPLGIGKAPNENTFLATVEFVETLGAESMVYMNIGEVTLVSRSREELDRREVGHRVHFEVNPERLYLFDPESSKRIYPE
ncbi:MAG: sn-glycerol-3-phosphate ABC transporter ATP-binding protein UgpC [Chthoniobacterales bacterium]|nr:sn-glycerol-3-phosphate ABC transporter ATP-binding protein UgpC [Chthoniobacterales bacterium]